MIEEKIAIAFVQQIISLELLAKLATIHEIGADRQLLNVCLKKTTSGQTLDEIISQLSAPDFDTIRSHLPATIQKQIRMVVSVT
jgi:hypothetical protein